MNLRKVFTNHDGKICDKWSLYLDEYERLFAPLKNKPVRILEIGIQNGGTLEVWSKYFPLAEIIIGSDIDEKCRKLAFKSQKIQILIGDINSIDCKEKIENMSSHLDIIIDDGSHVSSDIILSFMNYFPQLTNDGIYIIEDLHCSYWRQYEGGLYNPYSAISFFKRIVDIINYEHWRTGDDREKIIAKFENKYDVNIPEEVLASIHSVQFVNSMCIINKKAVNKNFLGDRHIFGQQEIVTENNQAMQGTSILNHITEIVNEEDLDIFNLLQSNMSLTKQIVFLKKKIANQKTIIEKQITIKNQLNFKLVENNKNIEIILARIEELEKNEIALTIRGDQYQTELLSYLDKLSWKRFWPIRKFYKKLGGK